MELRNKKTGEIEFMRYDPAMAAVRAGTHEHASASDAKGEARQKSQAAAVDPDDHTKAELRAIAAERGVEVSEADTKAEIAEAINAADGT